ncbi:hypothetical protein ACAX43_19255 [Paraburkholderia sp. IW21]
MRGATGATIGTTDPLGNPATPVHHQYDTGDFYRRGEGGQLSEDE